MVGPCPRCESNNTHDCSKVEYVADVNDERLVRMGSDCPMAEEIDDITIGHCDDCNYLWCLECGNELPEGEMVCSHWSICGDCGRTLEYPDDCPSKDEAESGELLLVNPCLCECPYIDRCTKCPYDDDISRCPKIKEELKKI
jgi:hypothetical protein